MNRTKHNPPPRGRNSSPGPTSRPQRLVPQLAAMSPAPTNPSAMSNGVMMMSGSSSSMQHHSHHHHHPSGGSSFHQYTGRSGPVSHAQAVGGTSPRIGTPRSSRSAQSSSFQDLEETIADIMGVRMQSLSELRQRVEELSDLQKREEDAFKHSMSAVLGQSEAARQEQEMTEQDLNAQLDSERNQRQRAVEMMGMFKREGGTAITKIKDALKEVQNKYKIEVEKNAKLTAQLRRYEINGSGRSSSAQSRQGQQPAAADVELVEGYKRKITTLSQLLEDEDAIVVELQQRNKTLENKVSSLIQQRDRLVDNEANQVFSDDASEEFRVMFRQVQSLDITPNKIQNMPPSKTFATIQLLQKFASVTYQNLKVEQRQRLRVEEQSARIAAAQDRQVVNLETRVRELEAQLQHVSGSLNNNNNNNNHTNQQRTSTPTDVMRYHHVDPLHSSKPVHTANNLQGTGGGPSYNAAGHRQIHEKGQRSPPSTLATHRSSSGASAPAEPVAEPRQQEVIGLDNIPSPVPRVADHDDEEERSTRIVLDDDDDEAAINNFLEMATAETQNPQPQTDGNNNGSIDDDPATAAAAAFPSLEDHLAAVTMDFQTSVEEWSKAINGGSGSGGGGVDDDGDFLPETPQKRV